jgi:hypothetical protein
MIGGAFGGKATIEAARLTAPSFSKAKQRLQYPSALLFSLGRRMSAVAGASVYRY